MIEVQNLVWGHKKIEYDKGTRYESWAKEQPDSNGSVSVGFNIRNHGDKPIRKYRILFKAFNGAGECVKCQIRHEDIPYIECADPLEAHGWHSHPEENLWYNKSIRSVRVAGIWVEYADGTVETCTGNYIPTQEEAKRDKKEKKNAVIIIILLFLFFALAGPAFLLLLSYLTNQF